MGLAKTPDLNMLSLWKSSDPDLECNFAPQAGVLIEA